MNKKNNNKRGAIKTRHLSGKKNRQYPDDEVNLWEQKTSGKFPTSNATTKKMNDVSWYAKNEQMLKDAASFSYNRPLGSGINYLRIFKNPTNNNAEHVALYETADAAASSNVPGVMTLVTAIGPGVSTDYRSPINLAAQNIYSYVRYANSGAANYEPVDLMLYMFAMDSIYACWNFYKRIYGMISSYDQTNWYMPRAFIDACGVDFNDIKNNIADFRLYLNTSAARISSFCVPASMPIFVRHSWIFANLWADSANQKAQVYHFVPAYFYQYDETSDPAGGYLNAIEWTNWVSDSEEFASHRRPNLKTFTQMKEYLDNLIDALSKSEDIGIMSGDILKAYGQSNLFKLESVSEDYTVLPVYNEEVLNQIHNATIPYASYHHSTFTDATWDIKQNVDKQILYWQPTLPVHAVSKRGTVLNMPWSDVTPANTMVGSRLACTYKDTLQVPTGYAEITSCGTEIVYNAYVSFYNHRAADLPIKYYGFKTIMEWSYRIDDGDNTTNYRNLYTNMANHVATVGLVSQFDWHPIMYNYNVAYDWTVDENPTGTDYHLSTGLHGVVGDMANWTVIDEQDLENMHLTAIMSEFNIPQIGSF